MTSMRLSVCLIYNGVGCRNSTAQQSMPFGGNIRGRFIPRVDSPGIPFRSVKDHLFPANTAAHRDNVCHSLLMTRDVSFASENTLRYRSATTAGETHISLPSAVTAFTSSFNSFYVRTGINQVHYQEVLSVIPSSCRTTHTHIEKRIQNSLLLCNEIERDRRTTSN